MAGQSQSKWLLYAVASGGCAALNGAFAKLVTTELTSQWVSTISTASGIDQSNIVVDLLARAFFLLMNIAFNSVMWALFTRALQLGSSTVRVSVINTSANFIITAILGSLVFTEELPGLWWLGASLLVAGSVIIGSREEGHTQQPANAELASNGSGVAEKDDTSITSGSKAQIAGHDTRRRKQG